MPSIVPAGDPLIGEGAARGDLAGEAGFCNEVSPVTLGDKRDCFGLLAIAACSPNDTRGVRLCSEADTRGVRVCSEADTRGVRLECDTRGVLFGVSPGVKVW